MWDRLRQRLVRERQEPRPPGVTAYARDGRRVDLSKVPDAAGELGQLDADGREHDYSVVVVPSNYTGRPSRWWRRLLRREPDPQEWGVPVYTRDGREVDLSTVCDEDGEVDTSQLDLTDHRNHNVLHWLAVERGDLDE